MSKRVVLSVEFSDEVPERIQEAIAYHLTWLLGCHCRVTELFPGEKTCGTCAKEDVVVCSSCARHDATTADKCRSDGYYLHQPKHDEYLALAAAAAIHEADAEALREWADDICDPHTPIAGVLLKRASDDNVEADYSERLREKSRLISAGPPARPTAEADESCRWPPDRAGTGGETDAEAP